MVSDDKIQAFVDNVAEPILGGDIEGVTAVILADFGKFGGTIVFGLEINGCMTPPIPLPGVVGLNPTRLSGRGPNGLIGA